MKTKWLSRILTGFLCASLVVGEFTVPAIAVDDGDVEVVEDAVADSSDDDGEENDGLPEEDEESVEESDQGATDTTWQNDWDYICRTDPNNANNRVILIKGVNDSSASKSSLTIDSGAIINDVRYSTYIRGVALLNGSHVNTMTFTNKNGGAIGVTSFGYSDTEYTYARITNSSGSDISASQIFSNATNLRTITGLEYIQMDHVTDLYEAFAGDSNLVNVQWDMGQFVSGDVKDMRGMFKGCTSLKTVWISMYYNKLDTMRYMFMNTPSLTGVSFTFAKRSNLTMNSNPVDVGYMFENSGISTFSYSSADTNNATMKVENERANGNLPTFDGCAKLTSLDLSAWNVCNDLFYIDETTCAKLNTIKTPVTSGSGTIKLGADYKDASGNVYSKNVAFTTSTSLSLTKATGSGTDNVAVTGVQLTDKVSSIAEGSHYQLVATVSPANATNKSVTWSSDKPSVAKVDANGYLTAVSVGTAKITVTTVDGGFTDSYTVSVVAKTSPGINPTAIKLNKTATTLAFNTSETLVATLEPEGASSYIKWSTSDSSIVRVYSGSGEIRARSTEGTATITATTINGLTATCDVTVVSEIVNPTGVSLDKVTLELKEGENGQLTATIAPANATDKTLTWSSSDTGVATVDTTGKVTAVKAGTATITVKTANDKSATCSVTVKKVVTNVDPTGITLDKTTLSIKKGESAKLTATVKPDNATNKTVTWSSSDASVVTVDSNGTVVALKEGTAAVTAKTTNNLTAVCAVTVTNGSSNPEDPVDPKEEPEVVKYSVKFYNDKALVYSEDVREGGGVTFIPEVSRNNCVFLGWYDKDLQLQWNPASAVYGTLNVYAVFQNLTTGEIEPKDVDPGDSGNESYDDLDDPSVTKEPRAVYLVKGQKLRLRDCTVSTMDKSTVGASKPKNGYVTLTARKEGMTQVTVNTMTQSGQMQSLTHTFYVGQPTLSTKSVKLAVGESAPIMATIGGYTDKYHVHWSTSNPDVAIVYNNFVWGVGNGSATVTANVNGKTYKCKVKVSHVADLKAITGNITMQPLQQMSLKFSDGFKTKGTTWTYSKAGVVEINKSGKITAVGYGTTTVTGMNANGGSKQFTVTVGASIPRIMHLNVGKSKSASFYKLKNKNAVWTSSNPSAVAVVGGKITANGVGTALVTANYNGFIYRVYVYAENPALKVSGNTVISGKDKYAVTAAIGVNTGLASDTVYQPIYFTSNKPEIARVNQYGVVIPCSVGKAKLTGKVNGKTMTVVVNVFGNATQQNGAMSAYGEDALLDYDENVDYSYMFDTIETE